MPAPTIETIRQLRNVGIFEDCAVGAFPHQFKPHNLIYGFNGSGKTTLSRLIDSFGERGLSPKFDGSAEFCVELSDGSRPNSGSLDSTAKRYIAVFNEDYVERSLAWSKGTAEAIVYVGEEQAELARQLVVMEDEERELVHAENLANSEFSSAERELSTSMRDIARQIAEDLGLGRNYNATNLKSDYALREYGPNDKQSEDEKSSLKQTINQSDLPSKILAIPQAFAITDAIQKTSACLETSLAKLTVESLERRKDALQWVKDGIELHEGEAESDCLFCGNELPIRRLENLKAALGEGFESLRASIGTARSEADSVLHQCRANRDVLASMGEAMPSRAKPIASAKAVVRELYINAEAFIAELVELLDKKVTDPEGKLSIPAFDANDWSAKLTSAVSDLQTLVDANNSEIENFSESRERAKAKLKDHHLANFDKTYRETVAKVEECKGTQEGATKRVQEIRLKISDARAALRTHGPAAAAINEILWGYLGHREIELVPNDEGYQLSRRGSLEPKPFSEGERTAVAFSHFLATLNSEGRRPQDFIVVLDDPISSLDAKAMTHAVALIRQRFDQPLQLFILTHNLEFMREMKKWLDKRYKDQSAEFLFIETSILEGKRASQIVKMPKLLREYESEYHYLYSLVKSLADAPADFEKFAYLMPNAMRKVLDIFLAFKIPGGMGLSAKVDKLIRDHAALDGAQVKAMERLTQLESHSESIGDVTTFSAYTLEQISDAAKCLMRVIGHVDGGHKEAMDRLCN